MNARALSTRLDGEAAPFLAVGAIAAGALAVVGCGAVVAADLDSGPNLCPFRLATGVPCPLCGVTRSLFALGGGDLSSSVAYAPVGPLVAVGAIAYLVLEVPALARGRPLWPSARLVRALLCVVAALWIVQMATPATP